MNFALKNKENSGSSVNLDMLSPPIQSVIADLNEISTIERISIGAAIVREPSQIENYEAFDSLIHDWIADPSSPYSRNVYLCFNYDSEYMALAPDMAEQFTEEILPEDSTIYGSRQTGSGLQIFVSCSVYCMWALFLCLDGLGAQYPSLISIDEVFMADLAALMTDSRFEGLISEMQEDQVKQDCAKRYLIQNHRLYCR